MKKSLLAWSEVLFIDITHKLLTRNNLVMLSCVQDSNGHTHICAVRILKNEEAITLDKTFQEFRKKNCEACHNVKIITTDKDLNEIAILRQVFPGVSLLLCEFHTLRTFARTITTSAFGISSNQRDEILNVLDKLCKSNSIENYLYNYTKLNEKAPDTLLTYYNKNWDSIKEEWTRFGMSKHNLGSCTNNPCESANGGVKHYIPPRSPLKVFLLRLYDYLEHREQEIKFFRLNMFKIPLNGYPERFVPEATNR